MKALTNVLCLMCFMGATTTALNAQDRSTSPAASVPDNTGVNKRDAERDTTTPMDQPNDKADIKVAADARSAIVKDKSLSTKAHNVKLIASGGTVTLRCPLGSAREKSKIETLVAAVPGVTRVDSQLDIAQ